MKNNPKILILVFFFYFLIFQNKILADEFFFDTLELEITANGNVINAGAGSVISKDDDIKIEAQNFKYSKIDSMLNATNGYALIGEKKIKIKADNFIYNKKLSTISALGNVEINDLANNNKNRIIIIDASQPIKKIAGDIINSTNLKLIENVKRKIDSKIFFVHQ